MDTVLLWPWRPRYGGRRADPSGGSQLPEALSTWQELRASCCLQPDEIPYLSGDLWCPDKVRPHLRLMCMPSAAWGVSGWPGSQPGWPQWQFILAEPRIISSCGLSPLPSPAAHGRHRLPIPGNPRHTGRRGRKISGSKRWEQHEDDEASVLLCYTT